MHTCEWDVSILGMPLDGDNLRLSHRITEVPAPVTAADRIVREIRKFIVAATFFSAQSKFPLASVRLS